MTSLSWMATVVTALALLALPTFAPAAPLAVQAVTFSPADGSANVTLFDVDPGASGPMPLWAPHWSAAPARSIPAVHPCGAKVLMKVAFKADGPGTYAVSGTGSLLNAPPQRVQVAADGTAEATFTPVEALPGAVGEHEGTIAWAARPLTAAGRPGEVVALGTTRHRFLCTLRPLVPHGCTFRAVVEWSCRFAAGLEDEKHIADALVRRLPETGLRYGLSAWDTYSILLNGGGMCGGWCQFFRDLCAAQGIECAPYFFTLTRQSAAPPEEKWRAIDIQAPGLNNREPTTLSQGSFVDQAYPLPRFFGTESPDDDVRYVESLPMYRFFTVDDGHCVNLLRYGGKHLMYDASFGGGPYEGFFDDTVPAPPMQGQSLAAFRRGYFDASVDHLVGNVSLATTDGGPAQAELDVKTTLVPDAELQIVWRSLDFAKAAPGFGRHDAQAARFAALYRPEGATPAAVDGEAVDWRRLRQDIQVGAGDPTTTERERLTTILTRRAPLALREGVPLPGVVSPLELLQGAALRRCAELRDPSLQPLVDALVRSARTSYFDYVLGR